MKNINPTQWKVIIESIVHSDALKKYQEAFNILEVSKNEYVEKIEKLLEQKQKFETKLNSNVFKIPIIGQWLKKRINNKIEKYNIKIKQLKDNRTYNGMREAWRNVWKEILTHYHDSNVSNGNCAIITIDSEALAVWQNQFIKHCELLVKNWQDKFVKNYELLFGKWQDENIFLEDYQLLLKKNDKIKVMLKKIVSY